MKHNIRISEKDEFINNIEKNKLKKGFIDWLLDLFNQHKDKLDKEEYNYVKRHFKDKLKDF